MEFVIPAAFAGVLSLFSPMLIQWITNASWTKNQKTLVAVGISAVIALALGIATGDIVIAFTSLENFLQMVVPTVGTLFTIQQVVYNTLFKGSDLADKINGTEVDRDNPEIPGNGYGETVTDEIPEEDVILNQ